LDQSRLTPLEFYAFVAAAFERRQIVGVEISRVTRLEWNLLSGRRIYLLIRFRDAVCFLSGLRVGAGLFVSWRCSPLPSRTLMVLFQIPFIGVAAEWLFKTPTFYREDAYVAFEQAVRVCVLEATEAFAHRGATAVDNEPRPLLREYYR
jgi:hypothetical protein